MSVLLACPCGKQLQVPEQHAGRRVLCPVCGASHVVPDPGAAAAREWKGATAAPARPPNRWWLLGGVVLLAVLLAGGVGRYFWYNHTSDGPEGDNDDLALIPPAAEAFVSIRLADLWKTPAARKAVETAVEKGKEDPGRRMDKETGLRPDEVERLSIVVKDSGQRAGWAVVRTREPYNRARLLAALGNSVEHQFAYHDYYVGKAADGEPRAVCFLGSRVVVAGPEEGVRDCLLFLERLALAAGPLTPAIELARGTHTAVLGIHPAGGTARAAGRLKVLDELRKAKRIVATLDVGERATLEAKATHASEKSAQDLVRTLDKNKKLLETLLAGLALMGEGDRGKVAGLLGQVLAKTRFTAQGDEVTARAELDGDRAAEMLLALPGAAR
jgi:hypothetical protein